VRVGGNCGAVMWDVYTDLVRRAKLGRTVLSLDVPTEGVFDAVKDLQRRGFRALHRTLPPGVWLRFGPVFDPREFKLCLAQQLRLCPDLAGVSFKLLIR